MRRLIGFVLAVSLGVLILGCEKKPDPVERGKYLVTIMGCHDCHTPKVPGPGGAPALDTARLLSGHPADLPYPKWTADDLKQRNALALTTAMLTAWAGPWGSASPPTSPRTRRRGSPNGVRNPSSGQCGAESIKVSPTAATSCHPCPGRISRWRPTRI